MIGNTAETSKTLATKQLFVIDSSVATISDLFTNRNSICSTPSINLTGKLKQRVAFIRHFDRKMKRSTDSRCEVFDSQGESASSKRVNLVERNESPDNYQLLNPYHVGRHSSLDIVALAQEIQNADIAMHNQSGKLGLIVDQIRFLQSQAHQILRDMKTDQSLHTAACNFKKIPGKTYYLYERESGQMYFSMLSPQEWGMRLTHRFVGGYRLEMDQTWTPLDRIAVVDENKQMTRKLLTNTPELSEMLSRQIGGAELMEST